MQLCLFNVLFMFDVNLVKNGLERLLIISVMFDEVCWCRLVVVWLQIQCWWCSLVLILVWVLMLISGLLCSISDMVVCDMLIVCVMLVIVIVLLVCLLGLLLLLFIVFLDFVGGLSLMDQGCVVLCCLLGYCEWYSLVQCSWLFGVVYQDIGRFFIVVFQFCFGVFVLSVNCRCGFCCRWFQFSYIGVCVWLLICIFCMYCRWWLLVFGVLMCRVWLLFMFILILLKCGVCSRNWLLFGIVGYMLMVLNRYQVDIVLRLLLLVMLLGVLVNSCCVVCIMVVVFYGWLISVYSYGECRFGLLFGLQWNWLQQLYGLIIYVLWVVLSGLVCSVFIVKNVFRW